MDIDGLATLDELLRILRTNGATFYEGSGIKVILGTASLGAELPSTKPEEQLSADDKEFGGLFADGRVPTFHGE